MTIEELKKEDKELEERLKELLDKKEKLSNEILEISTRRDSIIRESIKIYESKHASK